jgi:hypothetical protein
MAKEKNNELEKRNQAIKELIQKENSLPEG